jgi:hypothetical protein
MPGHHQPVNPLFSTKPELLPAELLLRLHFWHQAATAHERERWLPYSKEVILESENLARDLETSRRAVQRAVDHRLLEILEGRDARTVFKLDPLKKKGEHLDPTRNQAMTMEVLRLTRSCGLDEKEARELVGAAFHVDPDDVVRRAVREWRGDPRFSAFYVDRYIETLRILKLIE